MFKLIEALVRPVIALYVRKTKALDKASKVEAETAAKLARKVKKKKKKKTIEPDWKLTTQCNCPWDRPCVCPDRA